MNVWAVRCGKEGEYEDYALREGLTLVDFDLRRNATEFEDRDALRDHLIAEAPVYGGNLRRAANAASQLWKFANQIRPGDMILLPRKKTKTIAVGRVTGDYRLDESMPFPACHSRPVEWSALDVSRDDLDADIIKVIRSMLTVFQVKPEGAAERIAGVVAALNAEPPAAAPQDSAAAAEPQSRTLPIPPSPPPESQPDDTESPHPASAPEEETPAAAQPPAAALTDETPPPSAETEPDEEESSPAAAPAEDAAVRSDEEEPHPAAAPAEDAAARSDEEERSLDSLIEDRIIRRVREAFPGADLACLLSSILRGYGYTVASVSPPDEENRRVHILAGRGEMGFDGPGLLAHLYLGDDPASAEDCHRLRENARAVGAQRSLLVSMSGFSDSARRENERSFFTARLWDARAVVSNLVENYDRLPPAIRAAVPMQTRWTLVEA